MTARVSGQGLIDAIGRAGGTLRVASPSDATRRAYRRAIYAAREAGSVPGGTRLVYSGRDHGDLVIRLAIEATAAPRDRYPRLTIPTDAVEPSKPLRRLASSLRVSPALLPRATRILQAIAAEADRRGYSLEPGPAGSTFSVRIGDDAFCFLLFEEDEVVAPPAVEEPGRRRRAWQRVPPRPSLHPSGRLALHLVLGYRKRTWADRSRWGLESRLGDALAQAEAFAREAVARREARRQEAQRRRDEWGQAVEGARRRYSEKLHHERIEAQLGRWRQARDLRDFSAAVAAVAEEAEEPGAAGRVREWAVAVLREADRIDPLASIAELQTVAPGEPQPAELQPFMPSWLSAYGPPTDLRLD